MNAANRRLYATLLANLQSGVCPVHIAEGNAARYRTAAGYDDKTIAHLRSLPQDSGTADGIAFVQRAQARCLAKAEAIEQAILDFKTEATA